MTAASFEQTAEAPVHAPVTLQSPQVSEWTPPALPDPLSLLKVMGGVLLLMSLSFYILSLL